MKLNLIKQVIEANKTLKKGVKEFSSISCITHNINAFA